MVPGNNTMPNGIEMKNIKNSKLSFGKASNGTGGKNPPNKNQVVPVIDIEVWISVYVFTGHINATRCEENMIDWRQKSCYFICCCALTV